MDISREVEQVLSVLADKFGATGEYLWEILVRQQYVNFVVWFIPCVICSVACYLSVRHIKMRVKDEDWDVEYSLAPYILTGSGLGVILLLMFTLSYVGGLINPEYYALKEIMSMLP